MIKPITNSFQSDSDYKRRFKELKNVFKDGTAYVEFKDYYLHIKKEDNSGGIRWFHRNKFLVEVVIDASCYADNRPHQNIAPFVLFSLYEDAILHMVLTENKAVHIIEEEKRKHQKMLAMGE